MSLGVSLPTPVNKSRFVKDCLESADKSRGHSHANIGKSLNPGRQCGLCLSSSFKNLPTMLCSFYTARPAFVVFNFILSILLSSVLSRVQMSSSSILLASLYNKYNWLCTACHACVWKPYRICSHSFFSCKTTVHVFFYFSVTSMPGWQWQDVLRLASLAPFLPGLWVGIGVGYLVFLKESGFSCVQWQLPVRSLLRTMGIQYILLVLSKVCFVKYLLKCVGFFFIYFQSTKC